MTTPSATEGLLRDLAPQALGAVVRRYGNFADAEDAVQEALIAAIEKWPVGGSTRQSPGLADHEWRHVG